MILISSYKLINAELKADYEPFGKVNILVERIENNFRFPGQYYIKETGLYYNWWRWYNPDIWRYMEVDPLTRFTNYIEHSYIYVQSNPLIKVDFKGLQCGWKYGLHCPKPPRGYRLEYRESFGRGPEQKVCIYECDYNYEKEEWSCEQKCTTLGYGCPPVVICYYVSICGRDSYITQGWCKEEWVCSA
jgi:RHS repeat-associated protein